MQGLCLFVSTKQTNKQWQEEGYSFSPEESNIFFEKRPALSFRSGWLPLEEGVREIRPFCLDHWRIDAVLFIQFEWIQSKQWFEMKGRDKEKKIKKKVFPKGLLTASKLSFTVVDLCGLLGNVRMNKSQLVFKKRKELTGKNFLQELFQENR